MTILAIGGTRGWILVQRQSPRATEDFDDETKNVCARFYGIYIHKSFRLPAPRVSCP
jgi:hypothetical protein